MSRLHRNKSAKKYNIWRNFFKTWLIKEGKESFFEILRLFYSQGGHLDTSNTRFDTSVV